VRAEGAGAIRDAFRVEGSLDLPPGRYDLQANLRINEPPQFGSWTRALVVPGEPEAEAGPRFEGLILVPGDAAVSPLLISDENKAGTDPLSLGEGMRLLPPTHWGVEAGSPLIVMFWLAGLPVEEGQPPKVDFSVRVENADGAAVTPATRVLMFRPDGAGAHRGLLQIDPGNLPAGGYLLKLAATTPDGLAATTVAPFQIQGGGPPLAEAPETPPAAS